MNRKKLQSILFPQKGICEEEQLYFRTDEQILLRKSDSILMLNGSILKSDTYFNSFSVAKWLKYTVIDNLFLSLLLEGDFNVYIYWIKQVNGKTVKELVSVHSCISKSKENFMLEIEPIQQFTDGLIYFIISSNLDEGIFYEGSYDSYLNFDTSTFRVALNLCTYKREDFITRTVNSILENIIENPNLDMSDKFDIYVVDNGESIRPDQFISNKVKLFSQLDYGASGGFTRGLIEMVNSGIQYSYVIFMDDDVIIDINVLIRTYTFLSLLKDEYRNSILGGSFLKINEPYLQVECGGIWNAGKPKNPYGNLDLRKISNLLKNETEVFGIDYHPWFFCCIPFQCVDLNNLPLPMFMKRDDVEYGLRIGQRFIQLNGICVWHEGYEFKYNACLLYYIVRSTPMVNAIHKIAYSKSQYKQLVTSMFINLATAYNYNLSEFILQGAEDFLGGVNRIKEIDAFQWHEKMLATGYKKYPIETIDIPIDRKKQNATAAIKEIPFTPFRKLTLNGALLPAKNDIIYIAERACQPTKCYRAKKIYQIDSFQNKAFITEKNLIRSIQVFNRFRKLLKKIDRDYDDAVKDFETSYTELSNLNFWSKYLNLVKGETV